MSGKVVLYFYIVILAVLVYYRITIAEMYGIVSNGFQE